MVTCIEQLLDNMEVGMGDAVMEGCVAIAIGHVDHVLQQGRRDVPESIQVILHHGSHRRLLTGHAKPLMLDRVYARPLE